MDILGISGIILSLAIAAWEYRRAKRAEKLLAGVIHDLPLQVAEQVVRRFEAQNRNLSPDEKNQPLSRFSVSYADIDGDGADELLVQYPAGAHGSALDVFGWRDMEFRSLGGLAVGTPEGFRVEDFDKDGRLEVGTKDTDWSTNLPYYLAPRIIQWYRWAGNNFVKVHEEKDYTTTDLAERTARLLRDKSDSEDLA